MVHIPQSDPLHLSSINAFQRNVSTTTEHYNFINTRLVLEQLQDNGWYPVASNQAKVRKPEKEGWQKHNIKLEHPVLSDMLPELGRPSMLLRHSHDGSSSLQMLLCMYINLCSNGLVATNGDIGDIRVLHRGFTEAKLFNAMNEFLLRAPQTLQNLKDWRSIELTPFQRQDFARQALELRFDPLTNSYGEPTTNYPLSVETILSPRRSAEAAPTLYNTFQVVQEHLVKGGLTARSSNGRRMRTRAVRGVDSNVKLNKGLWTLAENTYASIH